MCPIFLFQNSTELTNVQAALDLPADQYGNDVSLRMNS